MLNIKSAYKRLQFGVDKCKVMFVGKNCKDIQISELYSVDKWTVKYENANHGIKMNENLIGQSNLKEVKEACYLGHMISNSKGNYAHIKYISLKSMKVKNKIRIF